MKRAIRTVSLTVPGLLLLTLLASCSEDWPMFRQNVYRMGNQGNQTALSDPNQVKNLAVRWTFLANGTHFRASPIVYQGRVYIGGSNGRFFCIDANHGNMLWVYPPFTAPA